MVLLQRVMVSLVILFHLPLAVAGITVEEVVKTPGVPWAFTWLPDGDMLVTERAGKLHRVRDGKVVAASLSATCGQ